MDIRVAYFVRSGYSLSWEKFLLVAGSPAPCGPTAPHHSSGWPSPPPTPARGFLRTGRWLVKHCTLSCWGAYWVALCKQGRGSEFSDVLGPLRRSPLSTVMSWDHMASPNPETWTQHTSRERQPPLRTHSFSPPLSLGPPLICVGPSPWVSKTEPWPLAKAVISSGGCLPRLATPGPLSYLLPDRRPRHLISIPMASV